MYFSGWFILFTMAVAIITGIIIWKDGYKQGQEHGYACGWQSHRREINKYPDFYGYARVPDRNV